MSSGAAVNFDQISKKAKFLYSSAEIWPDVMLVRYCLCFVVRALSMELAASQPTLLTPQLRRSLFDSLAICCEEGAQGEPGFENTQNLPWKMDKIRIIFQPWHDD